MGACQLFIKKQIDRIVSLCGVNLPVKFHRILERYGDNSVAMWDAGIAEAVDQIVKSASRGRHPFVYHEYSLYF